MKTVKNNIPELRFPEFSDKWKSNLLKDLLTFKNGINAPKEAYGSGYKFINVLDIINNDFILSKDIIGSVDVTKDVFLKSIVEYGDILFQRSSETREEVGQSSVYLDKENNVTFGGFVIRGKKKADYEPFFFHLLLKTSKARKEITTKSGGSTRYNIGQDVLSSVKLNFPSIPEQQKIASFLTEVDTKITQLTKKKKLLEQYKKGVMQQIFNQELRFKDNDGKEYPKWEIKKLRELCVKAQSGGTPKSTNKSYYKGNIPFLSISDMTKQGKYLKKTKKTISQLGIDNSSSWIVPKNSLIYSMYASVGFVSINKIDIATSQAVMNIILTKNVNIEYIYYFLLDFQKYIQKFIETGTQGNINASIVKGLNIKIPCIEEQTQIANFLSSIDDKINQLTIQLERTKTFKKGLLQQMFV